MEPAIVARWAPTQGKRLILSLRRGTSADPLNWGVTVELEERLEPRDALLRVFADGWVQCWRVFEKPYLSEYDGARLHGGEISRPDLTATVVRTIPQGSSWMPTHIEDLARQILRDLESLDLHTIE